MSISIFSNTVVENLRYICCKLKETGLFSRSELAKLADINPLDFDNFTTKKSTSKNNVTYKSKRPSDNFLKRIMMLVLHKNKLFITYLDEKSKAYIIDLIKVFDLDDIVDYDHLFNFLRGINAISLKQSKKICSDLSGNYYMYRLAETGTKKIVKSSILIEKFNYYRKTPSFKNILQSDSGRKETVGNILEIGDKYIFFGFVKGNERAGHRYSGIKLLVLGGGEFDGQRSKLYGAFISYDGKEAYISGRVALFKEGAKIDTEDQRLKGVYGWDMEIDLTKLTLDKLFTGRDLIALLTPIRFGKNNF